MNPVQCKIASCTNGGRLRQGYCSGHYRRLTIHGDPQADIPIATKSANPAESLAKHTERRGDCLIWVGHVNRGGYGATFVKGKFKTAHRMAFELAHGPIPEGGQIDHLCHNKACVEVAHLRLTSAKENLENLRGAKSNSSSGVRGVSWRKDVGKWAVQVMHNRRNYRGGYFDNVEDAERAAVALRNELFTHNDVDRRRQGSERD